MDDIDRGPKQILDRMSPGWGKYVGVDTGWYPLIVQLDADISALDPNYRIYQVKEKFGGLRYYIEPSVDLSDEDRDAVFTLVSNAEAESYKTCESCGCSCSGPKANQFGWILTYCDPCWKVYNKKIRDRL